MVTTRLGVHLLYDFVAAQPLSGRYHGGAEYCKAVFDELIALDTGTRITAFHDPSAWLDPELRDRAEAAHVEILAVHGKADIAALLRTGRYDRFYSALPYDYYDFDCTGVEFVFTIHGLRPIELPTDAHEARYGGGGRAALRAALKRTFRSAYAARRRAQFARLLAVPARRRVIVVPSGHTKYSLLAELPGLPADEIRVYYSPAKSVTAPDPELATEHLLRRLGLAPRSYFLILSGNRWVKNAIRAIEALDGLFDARRALSERVLVLGAERGTLRVRIRNEERFVFHDYVEPAELEALYGAAFALVFPTLNEGFGYPPLEAMRFGTPVICAAVGATTEVCADGVLYVNPWSIDEIRARALMLLLDERMRERMSQRARARSVVVAQRQAADLRSLAHLLLADVEQPLDATLDASRARGHD